MIHRFSGLIACLLIGTVVYASNEEPREVLFLSTPEQVAALRAQAGALIGGVICPLSGQPVVRLTDLHVKGAQELKLERIYIPFHVPSAFPKHKNCQEEYNKKFLQELLKDQYKGWQLFPHLRLQWNQSSKLVRFADRNGVTVDFHFSEHAEAPARLASPLFGHSNVLLDLPSGKYDLRNTRIKFDPHHRQMRVYSPDGSERMYAYSERADQIDFFLLQKEILPNGGVIRYHYGADRKLSRVESLDPTETHLYAFFSVAGSPWAESCQFESSTHVQASYQYQKKQGFWKIKDKIKKGGKYQIESRYTCPPLLTSVNTSLFSGEVLQYSDEFLLGSVSGKKTQFSLRYQGFGGEGSRLRVQQIQFPVAPKNELCPVFNLAYQPPLPGKHEGSTTVTNAAGAKTVFHFSKELLTTAIEQFDAEGGLRQHKRFFWTPHQWLQAVEIRDGEHRLINRRQFEYDRFGNPILELFSGNLTGGDSIQEYRIRRSFSEDGRNLLLSQEEESGKGVSLTYLPGTDLVASKFTKLFGRTVKRTFKLYDPFHQLVQVIKDNGSGEKPEDLSQVTQRKITYLKLRQESPGLHLPEVETEAFWDQGQEKILTRHCYTYDQYGNQIQEEVFDAEGVLRYTLKKTYNHKGELLSETNRLGQEAQYTYDVHGHRMEETSFSKRLSRTLKHDIQGRLIKKKERGDDGIVHQTASVHDSLGRAIRTQDQFKNPLVIEYDSVFHLPVHTEYPQLLSGDGEVYTASTQSTYDAMGRLLRFTDENGNETIYTYNAYGSVLQIEYPHGAVEKFQYEKNGQLSFHTDLDGLTTQYTRDPLGRVLAKTYLSSDGEELCKETYVYQGDLLISETDKMGNTHFFSYDGAGRKIKDEFCGRVIEYTYDALGRISHVLKHNGENSLLIHTERDLEGRVLEERKTDLAGTLLYQINYTYDADGNQESIIRSINGNQAIERFAYDSMGRLIEHVDAEGNIQTTKFDEHWVNIIGQRVLKVTTIDPMNVSTVETYDARGKSIRAQVFDQEGALVACREMRHDPHGNVLLRRDQIFENGLSRDIQSVKYTYTPTHQIETLKRAWGAKETRTTSYGYTPSGKIKTKILPDGVQLTYGYHPLGFIAHLDSSDEQIHHRFTYNLSGHLTHALDENLGLVVQREVDPFGNVTQEDFPCGLKISKQYDHFNRVLTLKMANQGEVRYSYDPLYLREVSRISNLRGILYIHVYKDYDRDGNLLAESLIGNLGEVTHSTDLKGQLASISSPFFSQECMYDSQGKLMNTVIDRVEHLRYYDRLSHVFSENYSVAEDPFHHNIRNGKSTEINDIYELLSLENGTCSYDLSKNQILVQTPIEAFCFTYDPLNRVVEVSSDTKKVHFVYDPLGRRMSKVVYTVSDEGWNQALQEHYVYHGQDEIGAFNALDQPKNLRVIGLVTQERYPRTVGVELDGQIFAPILDAKGNIRRLIKLNRKMPELGFNPGSDADYTTFNPWYYASIRLDPELAPVYFAKRLYDPEFARWIALAF